MKYPRITLVFLLFLTLSCAQAASNTNHTDKDALKINNESSTNMLSLETEDLIVSNEDIIVTADCEGYNGIIYPDVISTCSTPMSIEIRWKFDFDDDNSIDAPDLGWETSYVSALKTGVNKFPVGTHRIFWIINDECGNEQTGSQQLIVEAEKDPPFAFCYDGLAEVILNDDGTKTIWANDFNAGCSDGCGGDLIMSMIPEIDIEGLSDEQARQVSFEHANVVQAPNGDWGYRFSCFYMENGVSDLFTVRIYVEDENGNYAYCTSEVQFVDSFDACTDTGSADLNLSGAIYTEDGVPIEIVEVELVTNIPDFPKSEITVEDGQFSFSNLYDNLNYRVNFDRNDNYLNGISTLDIVMIQKHILGVDVITSPYKVIAADVNQDCIITGQDLVQLRKLILGKYPDDVLPENNSWRFVQSDYELVSGVLTCNYPQSKWIGNLTESLEFDFYGVKIGDVNASVQSNATSTAETRTDLQIPFLIDNKAVHINEQIEIPFYAKDFKAIFGFQFSLNSQGMEIQSIKSGALDINTGNYKLDALDAFSISYDNANGITIENDVVLFTIVLRSEVDGHLSDLIRMTSDGLSSEIYIGKSLDIATPILEYREEIASFSTTQFTLFQNIPNPVTNQTTIGFDLPQTSEATISIYDINGKLVFSKMNLYSKGINKLTVDVKDIKSTGVLYYTIKSGEFSAVRKMIILE